MEGQLGTEVTMTITAPAAMPSRGQENPRRGSSVSSRRGWGPVACEKKFTPMLAVLSLLFVATPAFAGPPFYCHVFDNGGAKSLPWTTATRDWDGRVEYDISNVVADTNALLTPTTPVLVRMETLRRASLYASRDRHVAERLLASLMSRVQDAAHADALAWFDAGYVVEAFSEIEQFDVRTKHGASRETLTGITESMNGRAMIEKSLVFRPADASIEFALGLLSRAPESEAHFRKARVAAQQDALLASNLTRLQLQ